MLDLAALIPEKVPVQTSLGTLYVAHRIPLSVFNGDQDEEVGRKIVRHTCSRAENKNDIKPLSDEDVAALSGEDIAMLGPVIARQQRWPEEDKPDHLTSIGQAAKRALERVNKGIQEELKKMQDSLKSSFGFLSQPTFRKLQEDMNGLSALRNLTDSASASTMLSKAVEDVHEHQDRELLEAMKKARIEKVGAAAPLEPRIQPLRMSRSEDSPLGRAALKNAENSEQTVELMRELTRHMAGLQLTLVSEVLPQWTAQVEREQHKANADSAEAAKNTANAAASLWWTKWGIGLSIVVTLIATGWQVKVAQDIDTGNTEQLQRAEKLLQEQLAAQRQAIEQQRIESQQLLDVIQKALEQRKQPVPAAPRAST